jgi:adenylate cyclase
MASKATTDLTVFFIDVADSTRLYEKLGDSRALREVERRLSSVKLVAEKWGAQLIKTMGDGQLFVFPKAYQAVSAAIEMQKIVANLSPQPPIPINIKIGFLHGPVVRDGDDVFGDTVNVASRICELAAGGQVLTAEPTIDLLPEDQQMMARKLGNFTVKGKSSLIAAYEFVWHQDHEMTVTQNTNIKFSSKRPVLGLKLTYRNKDWWLDQERPLVVIGRSLESDLPVTSAQASRTHAKIEFRNGKFVIIDQSTNGTYVHHDNASEIVLHREENILFGTGTIGTGHSSREHTDELIRFNVERG